MKVADYVANWIATVNTRVYAVCGAGAMHLNDSICHHPKLEVLAMHHEQAAAFAAEADARISGKPGIVLVTAGPGGTNAITGIASAYVDSIPMIIIAGQVTTSTLKTRELRQLGLNELPGTDIVHPITKSAITIQVAASVPQVLAGALYAATAGRPGPVWIEIPLDVQAAEIDAELHEPIKTVTRGPDVYQIEQVQKMLDGAQKPLIVLGNGARGADLFGNIPVVTSWNGGDIYPSSVGRIGIFGDKAANYAVQNADLLICIGTRLSVAMTGHHPQLFAPKAKKVIVDIDSAELRKPTVKADLAICCDSSLFSRAFNWWNWNRWRWADELYAKQYNNPIVRQEHRDEKSGVNAYYFVEQLQKHLADDAIVTTDVGIAYIATNQALRLIGRQRLFHSGGVSAMGCGLPSAIGAQKAGSGRQTICLAGDGGMMLNLQELHTVASNQIPLVIFVFANNGYYTIQIAQENHFKRHSISSPITGLSCPDFAQMARAFGIPAYEMFNNGEVKDWMEFVLTRRHPVLCVVHVSPNQKIEPRVTSKLVDGRFVPVALYETGSAE